MLEPRVNPQIEQQRLEQTELAYKRAEQEQLKGERQQREQAARAEASVAADRARRTIPRVRWTRASR